MRNMRTFPKISIVTPSYNQVEFIERTILSVLNQNYPNLEYIVIDGGSTDGTKEIIKKYEKFLYYWASEKDDGMYHAIEKGFMKATGEVLGWINSDDLYFPWTLNIVGDIFGTYSHIDWITSLNPALCDKFDVIANIDLLKGYSEMAMIENRYNKTNSMSYPTVQQESTFWRKSLWEKSDSHFHKQYNLAADFDLWRRFFLSADLYGIKIPLGIFRRHFNQKTSLGNYNKECSEILKESRKSKFFNLKIIRDLILFIRLNEVPVLKKAVIRLFGYKTFVIEREVKIEPCWVIRKKKYL